MRKNLIKKIILTVCSIFIFLLFVELALNVYSEFYIDPRLPKYKLDQLDKYKFNIFCLGDSFTYGIGAGFLNSYPAQLEKILNQTDKENIYKVYNFGVPGYNSSQVLIKLKQQLKIAKPNMIIVMTGANDVWNFKNALYRGYCLKMKCAILLSRYKIINFWRILRENTKNKMAKKINPPRLEPAKNHNPKDYANNLHSAQFYKLQNNYPSALKILSKLFQNDTNDQQVQDEIKDTLIRKNNTKQSIRYYRNLFTVFPESMFLKQQLSQSYIRLAGDYLTKSQFDQAEKFYRKAQKFDPENKKAINGIKTAVFSQKQSLNKNSLSNKFGYPFLQTFARFITEHIFWKLEIRDEILSDNLDNIIQLCKKNNIVLIFSQYPMNESDLIEEKAAVHHISLITHQDTFKNLFNQFPEKKYFISEHDTHCTKAGYGIVAKNIAKKILYLINSPTGLR